MEIDEHYFDDMEQADVGEGDMPKYRYQSFSTMSRSAPIDISGAFAMQGGEYAPYANMGVVYGGTLSSGSQTYDLTQLNYQIRSGSPQHLFATYSPNLGRLATAGYTGSGEPLRVPLASGYNIAFPSGYFLDGSYYSNNTYKNSWWTPALINEFSGNVANWYKNSLCLGFRYATTVLYVSVKGYDETFSSTGSGPLDEFDFDAYPNITQISYTIYSGNKNNRSDNVTKSRLGSFCNPWRDTIKAQDVRFNNDTLQYEEIDRTDLYGMGYNMVHQGSHFFYSDSRVKSTSYGTAANPVTKRKDTYGWFGCLRGLYSKLVKNETTDGVLYAAHLTKEECCKVVSTFGLYWTGTQSVAATATTGSGATDDLLRLPVAKNGVYYGDYVTGVKIREQPNADWGIDPDEPFEWWDDNGVTDNPDINDYTEDMPLNTPTITPFGVFNRAYAMSINGLNNLADFLWNRSDTVFESLVQALKLYGDDPMQALIDCRMYPFDVFSKSGGGVSQHITIGRYQTDIIGLHMGNVSNAIIDLGSCQWRLYHKEAYGSKCFLDYAPYSTGILYVPYVGEFTLNADVYAGHEVSVKLVVDFMTGSCQCVIYSDGCLAETRAGQIGVNVPFSSVNAAQWASGVMSGIGQSLQGLIGAATSVSPMGNGGKGVNLSKAGVPSLKIDVGQLAGGLSDAASGVYHSVYTPLPVEQKGLPSSAASQWLPQRCYLIIYTPKVIAPNSYGSSVGYACEKTSTLGELSGFTRCVNPDVTGFGGTQIEKQLLETWLQNGVDL